MIQVSDVALGLLLYVQLSDFVFLQSCILHIDNFAIMYFNSFR
jgi:hypothetical protein